MRIYYFYLVDYFFSLAWEKGGFWEIRDDTIGP